jgi:hypothetical protein
MQMVIGSTPRQRDWPGCAVDQWIDTPAQEVDVRDVRERVLWVSELFGMIAHLSDHT